jgi:iron uptake system component EfeO
VSRPVPAERSRRRLIVGAIGVLCVVIAGAAVVAVSARQASHATPSSGSTAVSAGIDDCGVGWSASRGGPVTFTVSNSTVDSEDVYLAGARSSAIYGEIEGLATNAVRTLPVVLGDGAYRFVCIPAESDPVFGPTVTISGAGTVVGATPAIQLVTRADLLPAAQQYQAWITSRLPVLGADVLALDSAVASGNLAAARDAWLTGHLEYESLGAAYGAFGDADSAINGNPTPGLTALADPDLAGFHKAEALLWGGGSAAQIAPVTAQLVADVQKLQTDFATARVNALDVGLRAHEILENAIQFELPATTDAGSHTNLATIGANIVGTRQALAPLEGVLASRYPDLAKTKQNLDRSAALLASYRQPDGSWTPINNLTHAERATLDSTLDATVELLAPVAAICDPRASAK